jgi:hypothetical protein
MIFAPQRPGPVRLHSAEIRTGMTEAEVEAVLGQPWRRDTDLAASAWRESDFAFFVCFDTEGRVNWTTSFEAPRPSLFDRLRTRLGLQAVPERIQTVPRKNSD